ncbi:MAG: hypothetical protein AAGK01_08320 [Pseudomonadota bacterium]
MTFAGQHGGNDRVLHASRHNPPTMPTPVPDDDGKLRAIPKAVFDGPNGAFLKSMGMSPDDPSNIIPQAEDFDRMVQESLKRQEERRCAIEADLLEKHGHNAIRPFFVCGEGVLNSELGNWMIRAMKLMPYDEWNVAYLPTDDATAAVMGLPLHPCQSIDPIDQTIVAKLTPIKESVEQALIESKQAMATGYDPDLAEKYLNFVDSRRAAILDYVGELKPLVIRMLAEVQEEQS